MRRMQIQPGQKPIFKWDDECEEYVIVSWLMVPLVRHFERLPAEAMDNMQSFFSAIGELQ